MRVEGQVEMRLAAAAGVVCDCSRQIFQRHLNIVYLAVECFSMGSFLFSRQRTIVLMGVFASGCFQQFACGCAVDWTFRRSTNALGNAAASPHRTPSVYLIPGFLNPTSDTTSIGFFEGL